MALKRTGILILLAITLLAVGIAALFLPRALENVAVVGFDSFLIRFLGLYGFLFLGIAALTTPFLAEITVAFGKPFKQIHHTFAAIGIVLITLHPIVNAVQRMSLDVFLPRFSSWTVFWMLAGRPALILFYVGVGAAFLRMKIPKYWRDFHVLIYVVLFFGIVHANLLGEDFANLGIKLTFDALFAAAMVGLAYKRYRNYAIKKKIPQPHENPGSTVNKRNSRTNTQKTAKPHNTRTKKTLSALRIFNSATSQTQQTLSL